MREAKRPRVTAAQIAEIRRRRAEGWGLRAIAEDIGCSVNTACRYGRESPPRRLSGSPACRPLQSDDFIAPPSLARLMAGR